MSQEDENSERLARVQTYIAKTNSQFVKSLALDHSFSHAKKHGVMAGPVRKNEAAQVEDLSALVMRLAHALRKAAPGNDIPDKALDYLKRHGMACNFRDEQASVETAPLTDERIVKLWAENRHADSVMSATRFARAIECASKGGA